MEEINEICTLEFRNIAPNDLEHKTRIEDKYLSNVEITCVDENKVLWSLQHYAQIPSIVVRSTGASLLDIENTTNKIWDITKGAKRDNCIKVPWEITQSKVAKLSMQYREHFENVTIARVVYRGVPYNQAWSTGITGREFQSIRIEEKCMGVNILKKLLPLEITLWETKD